MPGGCPRSAGNEHAARAVYEGMDKDKGIPPYVMAFAVMVALLLLPALA
jgi:hypothetical protein